MRASGLAAGLGAGALWLLLFGLIGSDLHDYAWWTVAAGAVAWLVSLLLARLGDRGVGIGIAVMTALGWSIAATAVAVRWVVSADWPMW